MDVINRVEGWHNFESALRHATYWPDIKPEARLIGLAAIVIAYDMRRAGAPVTEVEKATGLTAEQIRKALSGKTRAFTVMRWQDDDFDVVMPTQEFSYGADR